MSASRIILVLAVTLALAAGIANAYESLRGPTELLHWDKSKAYDGYTLFSARGTSYLIDMSGQVVHTWPIGTTPRLLASGNLLDASKDDPSGFQGFQELDWNGKVVWQYTETFATRPDRRGGETRRPGGQRQPTSRSERPRHPVLLALDADGDGEISAAEIDSAAAALLKLDANGDQRLSREELRPADGGQGRERGAPDEERGRRGAGRGEQEQRPPQQEQGGKR